MVIFARKTSKRGKVACLRFCVFLYVFARSKSSRKKKERSLKLAWYPQNTILLHTSFVTYISVPKAQSGSKLCYWLTFSLKSWWKKWKIQRILLQFQVYVFSDWHVTKYLYKCLPVYINIIITLFLIRKLT